MKGEKEILGMTLGDQLKEIIKKIEALEEEKAGIMSALKDVFGEAKEAGVDVRALKELLKLRKQEQMERDEQQSTLQTYMRALGMYPN